MKRFAVSVITILLIIFQGGSLYAEKKTSHRIAVSFSIPAVPGLNVPLIEKSEKQSIQNNQIIGKDSKQDAVLYTLYPL